MSKVTIRAMASIKGAFTALQSNRVSTLTFEDMSGAISEFCAANHSDRISKLNRAAKPWVVKHIENGDIKSPFQAAAVYDISALAADIFLLSSQNEVDGQLPKIEFEVTGGVLGINIYKAPAITEQTFTITATKVPEL